jgi:hypothetical protein
MVISNVLILSSITDNKTGFSKVFGHGTSVPVWQYAKSAQVSVELKWPLIGDHMLQYDSGRKYCAAGARGRTDPTRWPNAIVPRILQICSALELDMILNGMVCLEEISAVEVCMHLKDLSFGSSVLSSIPKDYKEGRRLFLTFLEALEDLIRTKSVSTAHLPGKFLAISLLILVEHSIATSCARAQRDVLNIEENQVQQPDEAGATILALCRLALPKPSEIERALLCSETDPIRGV